MSNTWVINRGDKPASFAEWDEDNGQWVAERGFRFHSEEAAKAALIKVPAKYKAEVREVDEAWENDPEIDDDGYPGDL